MARRDVIEITCDRCGRTETQSSTEAPKSGAPEIEGSFHGEKVCFNDLCKRCREAVKGYFSRISKKADDQAATPEAPEPKKHGFLGR